MARIPHLNVGKLNTLKLANISKKCFSKSEAHLHQIYLEHFLKCRFSGSISKGWIDMSEDEALESAFRKLSKWFSWFWTFAIGKKVITWIAQENHLGHFFFLIQMPEPYPITTESEFLGRVPVHQHFKSSAVIPTCSPGGGPLPWMTVHPESGL